MKRGNELKKTLLFLLFLLSGIILGTIITNLAQDVTFLKWLCWGDAIGVGLSLIHI